MQCTAITTQVGEYTLTSAIAEFVSAGDEIGEQPTPDELSRLASAFDVLRNWASPAASMSEAIAAIRVAHNEFRMGQEADGLAASMLAAAMGVLTSAVAFRPMPPMPWARRKTLENAA